MNKIIFLLIISFSIVMLILINLHILHESNINKTHIVNNKESTYQSTNTTILGYDLMGELIYKIISKHVYNYDIKHITYFIYPNVVIFGKNRIPIWIIKANKAKLIQKKILYLSDHVQINNFNKIFYVKCIKTNNIMINLITKEILSKGMVNLCGVKFNSIGKNMYVNLNKKIIKIKNKVNTYYEFHD